MNANSVIPFPRETHLEANHRKRKSSATANPQLHLCQIPWLQLQLSFGHNSLNSDHVKLGFRTSPPLQTLLAYSLMIFLVISSVAELMRSQMAG
jgi:hypothetical protein